MSTAEKEKKADPELGKPDPDFATRHADGSWTIQLREPLVSKERSVAELKFPARMKAKHMRYMDAESGDISKVLALIQALTQITDAELDELDAADVDECSKVVGVMRGKAARQPIGAQS